MRRYDEIRHVAAAFAYAVMLAMPWVAVAQGETSAGKPPGEVLEETTRRMLDLFRNFMGAIPQYEAPVVLDNGDILIKRKRTEPGTPVPDPEGTTRTRT